MIRTAFLLCLTSALLLAGCDDDPDGTTPADGGGPLADAGGDAGGEAGIPEGEVFETRGRLSVADLDAPTVSVWDLDVGERFTTYTLSAPAELYAPTNRQISAVVAVQPGADRFDVFGVGVWIWDHVEHFHLYKDPGVRQMDDALAFEGAITDVSVNGGWVVVFDDATGRATGLFERSIGSLRTDVGRTRAPVFKGVDGAAHDGAATVAFGHLFVTRADGGVARHPQGATAFEAPEVLTCADPGALGGGGFQVLVDCADDLLFQEWDGEAEVFVESRIPRPEGARPDAFVGSDDLDGFVGRVGDRELLFVSPTAATRVDVGADIVDAELDRDARWLLVLLEGGVLLDLDPVTGAERRRLELGGDLVDLAPGDGFAYLADAAEGTVRDVDLTTFAEGPPLEVGGRPGSLVVTGLWPGGEPVYNE
jgi:hypothetical protein